MEERDYVSFEIAKLLYERGFCDNDCERWYDGKGNMEDSPLRNYAQYQAPSLYNVQKWLREKRNIHIIVEPVPKAHHDDIWYVSIYDLDTDETKAIGAIGDYQKSLNRGIKEALQMI